MKLVTITGCLGFIGSYVTRECLKRDWKVYGIDKCTYAANTELIEEFKKDPNFTFCKEDIADIASLPECDYVINLAAESHVGNSIIRSDHFINSNVMGTQNLLELIRHKPHNVNKRPRFVHFSTDEVYGDIVTGEHKETDLLHPSNPYSAAKAAADMMVLAWGRTYNIEYNLLRPTNNYGKFQYHEKLIPIAVRCLQRGRKIRLHDQGEPIRTWLHAADTAQAVMTVIEKGDANEIYNISGGFEQTNRDTVRKIIQSYYDDETDWEQYVDLGFNRPGQDVRYSVDDSKIRSLGWSPQKVFDHEIKTIVEFYQNNFRW
jgi:dTDP-glucose 4,6-dehydratase